MIDNIDRIVVFFFINNGVVLDIYKVCFDFKIVFNLINLFFIVIFFVRSICFNVVLVFFFK